MRFLEIEGLGRVGRVGLGCWQFGSREWGYGDTYASAEAGAIVARALELGVTLFDTAEVYGRGKSETILGRALGDRRTEVQVASKLFPIAPFPAVARRRARASARRLQLEMIPLYQVHWPNPVVSDAVIMPGFRSLQDDGVIGAVGVSNYDRARWQRADAALGRAVISNQVQFSLAKLDPLRELVPFAAEHGRMIIAYSPLAQGLLGGRYDVDHRPTGIRQMNPLFSEENLGRAQTLIDTLREVAGAHDAKPAQVALAWLLAQPQTVVIPGASSVAQLESNVAAAELELAADEVQALTDAAVAFTPVTLPQIAGHALRARFSRTPTAP